MDSMLITKLTGVLISAIMNIMLTILLMLVFRSALLVTMLIRDHFMVINVSLTAIRLEDFPSKMIMWGNVLTSALLVLDMQIKHLKAALLTALLPNIWIILCHLNLLVLDIVHLLISPITILILVYVSLLVLTNHQCLEILSMDIEYVLKFAKWDIMVIKHLDQWGGVLPIVQMVPLPKMIHWEGVSLDVMELPMDVKLTGHVSMSNNVLTPMLEIQPQTCV